MVRADVPLAFCSCELLVELVPKETWPTPPSVCALVEDVKARVPKPDAAHVAKADSLVRVIRDEDLRKVVAKAAALSLANAANDRTFW